MKKNYLSKIKLISKSSESFPKRLYKLPDCPDILFILGNEKILNNFSIAIVGTRNSSKFGNEIAQDLSNKLSNNNITIVSGLASGIDSYAHTGAILDSKNLIGSTIAIVASGFNYIFTPKNILLLENILKNGGAIISEYFPDTPPQTFTFIKRNRLIAAISKCVIVVEAPAKSGALITAQIATNLNIPVFAVPWNINIIKGQGCNNLLKDNAHLLSDYTQILSFFSISNTIPSLVSHYNHSNLDTAIPENFLKLYRYISQNSPTTKEAIYSEFQDETIATINSKLLLMELQNLIFSNRK